MRILYRCYRYVYPYNSSVQLSICSSIRSTPSILHGDAWGNDLRMEWTSVISDHPNRDSFKGRDGHWKPLEADHPTVHLRLNDQCSLPGHQSDASTSRVFWSTHQHRLKF